MPLLEVNNLSVSFKTDDGSFTAVKGLSFSLERGESLAIVGESGSGKSVSSRAIMGLLDRRSLAGLEGDIWYHSEGESINLLYCDEKTRTSLRGRRMAMIFQEPMTALNPTMRCGKQVEESIRAHFKVTRTEAKAKVMSLFEEVQLKDGERIFRSYPFELSGGQRQRVMIAMALAADPELLIADEPTTALDVSVQGAILDLIRRLQKERNMALLFISHDLGVVKKVADRTLVMFRGEKVEEGESNELFSDPQHVYTRALIRCRPSAHTAGTRLPVMSDFFELDAQGNFIDKPRAAKTVEPLLTKPDNEVLIRITGLEVSYDRKNLWGSTGEKNKVIQSLDLDIYRGETLGILGESGSGKSTTGRSVMQLVKYAGRIEMNGQTLFPVRSSGRKKLAKKIQLIYQDPYSSLNPKFRISKSFLEIQAIHGIGKNDAERAENGKALLERVGLGATAWDKYPHEFSGGQRQRVAIARALLVNPECIVCDEAVSALDVSVQAQIINLLKDLQQEFGLTYIFITHDLHVARHLCDRILVLNKGRVAELKSTPDLFGNPENEYTRHLLSSYANW